MKVEQFHEDAYAINPLGDLGPASSHRCPGDQPMRGILQNGDKVAINIRYADIAA